MPEKYAAPRAACSTCGRYMIVRADGKIRMHRATGRSGFLTADQCPGGGREPRAKGSG